jgi:predicted ATP-dependent endonuclease of OLD family
MKIQSIRLHNFRSVKNLTAKLSDYSLLVGENNCGKTTLLTALRTFYEEGGSKFSKETDFPKFTCDDKESWIEISYSTISDEQESLKEVYRSDDHILRVRRYFISDNDLVKPNQSNIYAYEQGQLSKNLFYGAKNVSEGKFGTLIYIPEVNKPDDALKTSGPSPFREMVNFVMKRAVQGSESYTGLTNAFGSFNNSFQDEFSKDGFSVRSLVKQVNDEIEHWNIKFGVTLNTIRPEDIVKNLLTHYIQDQNLSNQQVSINSFGQGLQRHLIYTLIKLSVKFGEPRSKTKKDFSPDFTLILFEEPEAFLHPSQQERLNHSLRTLAAEPTQQVLISTHSPRFVSREMHDVKSIIRLQKTNATTECFQLSGKDLEAILDSNRGLYRRFSELLGDANVPDPLKVKIRRHKLGSLDEPEHDAALEDEGIRYMLWLDAERAALFFARHVVICEGATEKVLFDLLLDSDWADLREQNIYFADALGKYNVHRCIALLSGLGIRHSVLIDGDADADVQAVVNGFIAERRTLLTNHIESFPIDIESFLGVAGETRRDLKPLRIVSKLKSGAITHDRITDLRAMVDKLLGRAVKVADHDS